MISRFKCRSLYTTCFASLMLSVPALGGDEASLKRLDIDTYMEMESIRSPAISPDGTQSGYGEHKGILANLLHES